MKRGLRGRTKYYSAFTKDEYIANDLEDEPWTSNIISGLQSVSSGRHVALGPGARGNSSSMEESSLHFPEGTSTGWQNFWFDARNSNKKCIEGAFSNLLHHMQDHKVAIILKNIATQSNPSLIASTVGVDKCPKCVTGPLPDDFKKCLWILHHHGYQYKKMKSKQSSLATLINFGFPVIGILKGTNMTRDHVIGIWQNKIIDYESEHTYPLTLNNLNYACGNGCEFLVLVRPFAVFPPKSIRKKYVSKDEPKFIWIDQNDISVKKVCR